MINVIAFLISLAGLFAIASQVVGEWFPLYNIPALGFILIGLVAMFTFVFGITNIPSFFNACFELLYNQNKDKIKKTISGIIEVAHETYTPKNNKLEILKKIDDPFLREAVHLKLEGLLNGTTIYRVLKNKSLQQLQHRMVLVEKVKTLAKFSPALGVLGTLLAVIGYTAQLDKAVMAQGIGELLLICLYSTLYGFLLSNFIFMPLAMKVEIAIRSEKSKNDLIAEGMKSLSNGTNPTILKEELNSLVTPENRVETPDFSKQAGDLT